MHTTVESHTDRQSDILSETATVRQSQAVRQEELLNDIPFLTMSMHMIVYSSGQLAAMNNSGRRDQRDWRGRAGRDRPRHANTGLVERNHSPCPRSLQKLPSPRTRL